MRCSKQDVVLPRPTALAYPLVQEASDRGISTRSLNLLGLYALRERTLGSSTCLAWMPDLPTHDGREVPRRSIYLWETRRVGSKAEDSKAIRRGLELKLFEGGSSYRLYR